MKNNKTPKKRHRVEWFSDDINPNPLHAERTPAEKLSQEAKLRIEILETLNKRTKEDYWSEYDKMLRKLNSQYNWYYTKQKWAVRRVSIFNWIKRIKQRLLSKFI